MAQVLGDSEVELTNGSYYSLLCQTNKAVGNFTWQFNNIPIQVREQETSHGLHMVTIVCALYFHFI